MKFMIKDKTTTSENTDAYINVHTYAMYMRSVQMSIYICVYVHLKTHTANIMYIDTSIYYCLHTCYNRSNLVFAGTHKHFFQCNPKPKLDVSYN